MRPQYKTCPKCNGKGCTVYVRWADMPWDGYEEILEDCEFCLRYGIVLDEPKPTGSIR